MKHQQLLASVARGMMMCYAAILPLTVPVATVTWGITLTDPNAFIWMPFMAVGATLLALAGVVSVLQPETQQRKGDK
jgi:hypothetical protein